MSTVIPTQHPPSINVGREIYIPLRCGHITGLEWGPKHGKRILALHGWLDNANSFVPLVEHLAPNFHIVAIDLPGHGYSSHFGPGVYYTTLHYISAVIEVVNYLKWDVFSILGHSLGAIIGIGLTANFPHRVENLISLDIMYPDVRSSDFHLPTIIERNLELEDREFNKKQLEVTWQQGLDAIIPLRGLSMKNNELLLRRSLRKGSKPGYYIFTRDHRLKLFSITTIFFEDVTASVIMEKFSNYTGNWLVVLQNDDKITANIHRRNGMKDHYTKSCNFFKVVVVDEGHFMHMENPKLIASLANDLFKPGFQIPNSKL